MLRPQKDRDDVQNIEELPSCKVLHCKVQLIFSGLCYGKLEAGILTFVIPILLLVHLSGLMDDGAKLGILGVWNALFTVFAARKFQHPVKDDISDKSVFMFNAIPEKEKKVLLQKLEAPTEQKFE